MGKNEIEQFLTHLAIDKKNYLLPLKIRPLMLFYFYTKKLSIFL